MSMANPLSCKKRPKGMELSEENGLSPSKKIKLPPGGKRVWARP